jgi:1-acyl-sn-glycerol-3-phosphate acyltransferase
VLRTAWFSIVLVASSAFFSSVSIVGALFRAPARLHDWVHRGWARSLLRAAGVEVRTTGLEQVAAREPQIVAANHQSFFDILALFAAFPAPVRFVAKQELSRIPLFSQAMRAAGHVFIDRADRRGATETMRAAGGRYRREGLTLGLFPEGTRSANGHLGPFKKGSFVLAIETGLPILPVALDGGWRIVRDGRVHPGVVRMRVAPAVPTEGLTADDRDAVLAAVRGEIERELDQARAGLPPEETPGPAGGPV